MPWRRKWFAGEAADANLLTQEKWQEQAISCSRSATDTLPCNLTAALRNGDLFLIIPAYRAL
jgi:hypothetical protein